MTDKNYPELPNANVWVIPGDDNADMRGFLDAKAWQEDEFSKPMFTADQMRAYVDADRAARAQAPQPSAAEAERDRLRAEQTAAVMPLIGPLLDAWDSIGNDTLAVIREHAPGLAAHIGAINRGMEYAPTASEAPTVASASDDDTINGKPATAQSLLAALIDIHDDYENKAPEDRCYVPDAWGAVLQRARRFLALAASPTEGAESALRKLVEQIDRSNPVDDHGHDLKMNAAYVAAKALL